MGIMDSLSGLFSGGGGNTQAPMDKDKLSALLAAISSGNGGGSTDYAALMDAYNPAPKKTNILSDLGDSLVQTSAKNPLSDDFGTLGLALADMNSKKKLADEKYQEQGKESIADLMGIATNQRTFGLDSKKHADKTEHDKATLAETLRNNIENNKYHNAMATVARSNAENGKYGAPVIGDDGKPYVIDSKSGKMVPIETTTTFNNTKKKPVPSVTFKEGESAWDGLNTALGGNLDAKSKPAIMAIFSEKLQENNNNAPAALQSMVEDFGIKNGKPTKGFKDTGSIFTNNFEYTGNQPSMAAAVGGKNTTTPPQAAIDKLKKNPTTSKQFDDIFGAGASNKVLNGK